jgi:predicted DNA-binding transcriptional regulator YafY
MEIKSKGAAPKATKKSTKTTKKAKTKTKAKATAKTGKSSPNSSTNARYYRMLEMVNRGDFPNATDFKRELGMSPRSVTRDFAYLQLDYGVPVEYCPKRKGWYFTEPVTHFPAMLVGASEIMALMLARRAMERTRNAAFLRPLDSAMEKFGIVMTDEVRALCAELDSVVSFRSSSAEVLTDVDVCMKVCDALLGSEEIELDYCGLKDGTIATRRRLQPYHLLCMDSAWYLFAVDPTVENDVPRRYVLSRMSMVTRTGAKFERPRDFTPDELLAHSIGVYGGDEPEHLHVRLQPRAATWFGERRFHPSQKFITHEDGTAELTMEVAVNPELERLILGWGAQAEVLSPQSLRESIWREAKTIAERGK